jgi:hypothetical protein
LLNRVTSISECQPRTVQERASERRLAPDPAAARMHRGPQRREVGHAEVRQFAALQVAPERFDRIELRGVPGQRFDLQPSPLRGEVVIATPNRASAARGSIIITCSY